MPSSAFTASLSGFLIQIRIMGLNLRHRKLNRSGQTDLGSKSGEECSQRSRDHGRGGHAQAHGIPNENCRPDRLTHAAAYFGVAASTRMLCFYATIDSFFGPRIASAFYQTFTAAAGNAVLRRPRPYDDGHHLLFGCGGSTVWGRALMSILGRNFRDTRADFTSTVESISTFLVSGFTPSPARVKCPISAQNRTSRLSPIRSTEAPTGMVADTQSLYDCLRSGTSLRLWCDLARAFAMVCGQALHTEAVIHPSRLQYHVFLDHDVEQVAVADPERGLNIEAARDKHCADRVCLLAEGCRKNLRRWEPTPQSLIREACPSKTRPT